VIKTLTNKMTNQQYTIAPELYMLINIWRQIISIISY